VPAPSGVSTALVAPPPAKAAPGGGVAASRTVRQEMLDIEAHVGVKVKNVAEAVRAVRELAQKSDGTITEERLDESAEAASAKLTLRVPAGAAYGLFAELERLGQLISRNVAARDVGKQYFDAELRLSSLEATRQRYEQILSRANTVEEVLRIEAELARLRQEIEQVKGTLRWLTDRVARATVHVSLMEDVVVVATPEPIPEPEPKFYPSLRGALLLEVNRETDRGYGGGGIGLRFSRHLSFDLDLTKRFDSQERGIDALLATAGGETYSQLLGGGRRTHLNPYLGFRLGYARLGTHRALLGATLGVELAKTSWLSIDVEARNYLTVFGEGGARYLLEPALAASVAF
jgi:hypothetical protein